MAQFLKLRGLPYSASPQDVINFLNGLPVLDESSVSLTLNDEGRPSGEAIIRLGSTVNIGDLSAYNGQYMGTRFIEVFPSSQRDFALSETRKSQSESTILRIRGLPYDVTREDIYVFFNRLMIARDGVGILMGPDGVPTGEAFIQFMTKEDANMAQQRHNSMIRARYIEVYRSSMMDAARTFERQYQINRDELMRSFQMGNQFQMGGGNNFVDPYYGQQPSSAGPMKRSSGGGSSRRPGPYSRKGRSKNNSTITDSKLVFMRGLPYTAVDKDIEDFFAPLKLESINIIKGSDGKATGEAEAVFHDEGDAKEAMSKDRCKMSWRYIELFLGSAP